MARHTPVALIGAFCLMSGAASAQVTMGAAPVPGVRYNPSPPRPEPPPANPDSRPHGHTQPTHHASDVTTGRDVFLARPDTYKPRRDALPSVVPFFYPGPAVREVVFVENVTPPVVVERTKVVYVETPVEREPAATPGPPVVPAPRIIVAPKTLYVIPRCYAGDKPPIARDLPAGCDIRDLRIIRP